jgi:pyruvate carboxylase
MQKVLVANRSEIAIRCFRAATELGLRTVAVYSYEDRFSLHRFKADQAFLIGPPVGGEPVRSYLNIDAIVEVARAHGADAVHPGYGFLAENADFARACEAEGLAFIGPTADQLQAFGDKTTAKDLATKAGVPTLPGTPELTDPDALRSAARDIGYPLIVKARFGGGGRGMRVVSSAAELPGRVESAQREAQGAFGHAGVFLERYIPRAKHIEVQVLGDGQGAVVHLWERDCSVQRRHQKVVEVAPAVTLAPDVRERMCAAAVRLCAAIGYRSAGTVEFLYDADTKDFHFIEVNPRIQVEHTVTEMVTGIDLVRSQILIAQGARLHEPPLALPRQERIEVRGVALQCRITTEDPENQFIPDYGRLTTYRSSGGFAVRLDGSAFAGAVITPYFDSLLVKLTTWGTTLDEAVRRADRSLREFRIRGVKTNVAFLLNLLQNPVFASGDATTTLVDSTPELFRFTPPRDRATKLLRYVAGTIVNGRADVKRRYDASRKLPTPAVPAVRHGTGAIRAAGPPPGTRQTLQALGPEKFAAWMRSERRLLLTDTTMRDAHQSLLATRVRSYDLVAVAEAAAHLAPNLFSLEMWGGATFDTCMRFMQEDPWQRLIDLRARIPNILFQMLMRGNNAVGYTHYPDNVVREFIRTSATHGIDVFRIFDSLNNPSGMRVAMEAVRTDTDALCEAAICYTGDLLDPARPKYGPDYYVKLARELVRMGTHVLAIKDMAGLCKPYAAKRIVEILRNEVDVPIHFHTHDTSGLAGASVLMAADAGVDAADGALAAMSGMTSQPCLNSIVAALRHGPRDTEVDPAALDALSRYWADVRELYYPFEEGLKAPASDVYRHEMPGGQYTNLRQQAASLGLGDRWSDIAEAYAAANQLFGDIVKVTPSSKVVGDMALFMVANGLTADQVLASTASLAFPRSVVEMMEGRLGVPPDGWPEALQRRVLASAGLEWKPGLADARPADVDLDQTARALQPTLQRAATREEVLSYVLYPQVFADFAQHLQEYDNTSVLPTATFFYGMQAGEEISVEIERGKTLIIRYLTTGDAHEDGTRTVFFELNGQPRAVAVRDESAAKAVPERRKADPSERGHVGAPMPGKVSRVNVSVGEAVKEGDALLFIEAMKMETTVYSPRAGLVDEILVTTGTTVKATDLLVVISDNGKSDRS